MTLLVLAAGMGSRYGGLKQIDPLGPAGETLLDYAVYDAIQAGFKRIVFVIRPDFEEAFKNKVTPKYAGHALIDIVHQTIDQLPEGFQSPPNREKPWGTGHAVWCARNAIKEPFSVIGADDFFGRDAFEKLATFFKDNPADSNPASYAMVGYRLANTLSENGTVSRGVCETKVDGSLKSITEHTQISPDDIGQGKSFSGEEIVSMNCWAFTPAVFKALDEQFTVFLQEKLNFPKSEFYLPDVISRQIAEGSAEVKVLPTNSIWFGITYTEDKLLSQKILGQMHENGSYPTPLFGK